MKRLKWIATLLVVANLLLGVIGCKDPEPAHEHTFSDAWSKDGTYHWHAATCEHTTEVSGKAEHSFGEYVSNNDATTEADGTKTRECSVCGYKDTVTDEGSKIHVHIFAEEWTSDSSGHWHAATCGHTTEVSGKAAHSFGDWTVTKAATEEAEGSRERSCTVCGYTATEAIEKLAHTHKFATDWTKDETHHWYAAICEHTTEVSEKAAHSFGDWTVTKAATEEAEGSKERTCTVCGYTATETIEKLAHTHKFAEAWTSDANGHWHEASCEHTTEVSGKAEHSFGEYVSNNDATTEADGTKTKECSVCGYKDTVTDEGSKIHVHTFAEEWTGDSSGHWHEATCGHTTEVSGKAAHSFGDWTVTKAATEEAEGTKERTCTVCGYTATEAIEKLAHTHKFATDWTKDETHHWYAAICEHKTEVSEKAEHTFGNWITTKEATEEAEGSRERSCIVCGYTATEAIEKLAHIHKFAEEWTSDSSGHWHAATCEDTDETSGFAWHSFGDWTTIKEATCTQEGKKTVYCTVCKYEKEKTIPAKHTFAIWNITKEPTETESGKMQSVCEVCGETVTKELQPAPEGFRFVEAGSFQMGSNIGLSDDEKPVHEVTITKSFYMGKYEVTQAEYEKYCSYTGSESPSSSLGDGDNYPAYYVNWYDALVYCNKRSIAEGLTPCYSISDSTDPEDWGEVPDSYDHPSCTTWDAATCDFKANGYRLPTEAEWEYAARAGDNTVDSLTYSGTSDVNKLGEYAWYMDNSNSTTHEVGTKLPNAFGLYDMSGNVYERCWNWHTNKYDENTEGGDNPTGTSAGSYRVYRGGSWYSEYSSYWNTCECAVSCRDYYLPYYHDYGIGFRVVRASSK